MHIYIYDSFVNQKKYDATAARIETRITDLGLNGKIVRLGIMNSINDVIENEIKKGAKTIVVVGNDKLFNQAINSMARISQEITLNRRVPLGFIPIGKKDNELAKHFGIEMEEAACNIISARRIQKLDLGLANEHFFLTHARISTAGTILEIDKSYTLEIGESGEVFVVNLPILSGLPEKAKPSAQDNTLELFISKPEKKGFFNKKNSDQSLFPFSELRIKNKKHPVIIDESVSIPTPVDIQIAKQKLHMIVGKGKEF